MQKIAIVVFLLLFSAMAAFAQAPTLTIKTETPGLPSELFYGNVKVKPVRLRPGTNTPITIDDSDFFVQQQYIDFLTRFPDQSGFNSWLTYLNGCNGDSSCLYGPNGRRIVTSSGFFGSQEFNLKGGYVFRFYRASFGPSDALSQQAFANLPQYPDMITGMQAVTGTTAAETNQKRADFATNWVLRTDFLALYPRSLTPTQFVDNISATAGITLSNRNQIITDLTNAGNTDAARGVAMKAIVESQEEQNKEFNPSFVYMQYVGYLRRFPDQGGFTNWLNYLNAHPSDFNTMVWGFVDSGEYRNRF